MTTATGSCAARSSFMNGNTHRVPTPALMVSTINNPSPRRPAALIVDCDRSGDTSTANPTRPTIGAGDNPTWTRSSTSFAHRSMSITPPVFRRRGHNPRHSRANPRPPFERSIFRNFWIFGMVRRPLHSAGFVAAHNTWSSMSMESRSSRSPAMPQSR